MPHLPGRPGLPPYAARGRQKDGRPAYCADSATKEDDACSNSCYPLGCTSVVDHLSYLGLVQGIGGCIEL